MTDQKEQDECSICMEMIGSVYQRLKCDHKFHIHCLDEWSNENKTCPICRALIKIVQNEQCRFKNWHQTGIEKLKEEVTNTLSVFSYELEQAINMQFNPEAKFGFPCNKKIFIVSTPFQQSATNNLHKKLDGFEGIDINKSNIMDEINYNKSFKSWWDNIKYEWIGDHFFYPFLSNLLSQQIMDKTQNNKYEYNKSYFTTLNHIISKNIIFKESYTKSQKLFAFFKSLGEQQSVPFVFSSPITPAPSGKFQKFIIRQNIHNSLNCIHIQRLSEHLQVYG